MTIKVWAVLATCAALGMATAALAQQAGTVGSVAQANAALRDELTRSPAPSMSDPAHARLVAAAFDLKVLDQVEGMDLPSLMNFCTDTARTALGFETVGLSAADLASLNSGAPPMRIVEAFNRNAVGFQDEIAASSRFSLACTAVSLPQLAKFSASLKPQDWTPARRDGMAQMQRGLVQTVSGVAAMQLDPIRPANRLAVLDEALKHVDVITAAMTPESRKSTAAAVQRILESKALDAGVRVKLGTLLSALSRPDCTGLCAASG